MQHKWELKVGVELHGGSSLPTRIRCKHCLAFIWAYRIQSDEARKLSEQECPGRKS
jgi:hypothetical protein